MSGSVTPPQSSNERRASIPRPIPSPSRLSSPTTPTQGVRRASTPTTPPANRTRARDLLRKHYGLGVGPPPPLIGKAKSEDPMDLDSSAFDARTYYSQLITTSSLSSLLRQANELFAEIRQLVGDRQSLVYNHHHELIAATDIIASMKTRADSLDTDLDQLRLAFSEISRLGAEVAIEDTQTQHTPRAASKVQAQQ